MTPPITDRELRVAAMAVITYNHIMQTGSPPIIGEDDVIEATAFLDNEVFEKTLEIVAYGDIDAMEMYEVFDEDDDDEEEADEP